MNNPIQTSTVNLETESICFIESLNKELPRGRSEADDSEFDTPTVLRIVDN